jgi:hypothetical protein
MGGVFAYKLYATYFEMGEYVFCSCTLSRLNLTVWYSDSIVFVMFLVKNKNNDKNYVTERVSKGIIGAPH